MDGCDVLGVDACVSVGVETGVGLGDRRVTVMYSKSRSNTLVFGQ